MPVMTSEEFRDARKRLGLTGEQLEGVLGIVRKVGKPSNVGHLVRRYESGSHVINPIVSRFVEVLLAVPEARRYLGIMAPGDEAYDAPIQTTRRAFVRPESSNVIAVAHDGNATLWARFASGDVYEYAGVPVGTYLEFAAAPSAGRFMASRIRTAFEARKLEQDEAKVVDFNPTDQPAAG